MEGFLETSVKSVKDVTKKFDSCDQKLTSALLKAANVGHNSSKASVVCSIRLLYLMQQVDTEYAQCGKDFRKTSMDLVLTLNEFEKIEKLAIIENVTSFVYSQVRIYLMTV